VQLSPDTRDNTWDGSSGCHYFDTSILGFSHNHLTGTSCAELINMLTTEPTPSKSFFSAPGIGRWEFNLQPYGK
jgi:putative alpha-1,2-mannosidase